MIDIRQPEADNSLDRLANEAKVALAKNAPYANCRVRFLHQYRPQSKIEERKSTIRSVMPILAGVRPAGR